MQKRLFLGISIPEDIKKRLFRIVQKDYWNLPVSVAVKENYHVTLVFFGYVQEEKIPEICRNIHAVTEEQEAFEINFLRVEAGPNEKSKRLIWATGEDNNSLTELKNNLDREFLISGRDRKIFVPHITLGRIKRGEWKKLEKEPQIKKEFLFSVPVSSVELFESKFEKGKRIYYVMETFALK
jgi:RNA 2',3'-cyclic 3'-phosphodiesterase